MSFALQLALPKMARSGGTVSGPFVCVCVCSVRARARACDALLSVKGRGEKKNVSAVFSPLAIRCFYDYVM